MAQNINLYHAGLEPPRKYFTALHGLGTLAVAVIGVAGTALVLQHSVVNVQDENQRIAQSVDRQRGTMSKASIGAQLDAAQMQELERLRRQDAGEARMRAVMDSGLVGAGSGFSVELLALGRRAHANVWLTGLSLDRQNDAVELHGRTTDASILPGYLRTLQDEATFRGRHFAQMQVNADGTDESGAPVPWAEFILRTNATSEANAKPAGLSPSTLSNLGSVR